MKWLKGMIEDKDMWGWLMVFARQQGKPQSFRFIAMKVLQQIDDISQRTDRVTEDFAPTDPNRKKLNSIKDILSTIQKDLQEKQSYDNFQSN